MNFVPFTIYNNIIYNNNLFYTLRPLCGSNRNLKLNTTKTHLYLGSRWRMTHLFNKWWWGV